MHHSQHRPWCRSEGGNEALHKADDERQTDEQGEQASYGQKHGSLQCEQDTLMLNQFVRQLIPFENFDKAGSWDGLSEGHFVS